MTTAVLLTAWTMLGVSMYRLERWYCRWAIGYVKDNYPLRYPEAVRTRVSLERRLNRPCWGLLAVFAAGPVMYLLR